MNNRFSQISMWCFCIFMLFLLLLCIFHAFYFIFLQGGNTKYIKRGTEGWSFPKNVLWLCEMLIFIKYSRLFLFLHVSVWVGPQGSSVWDLGKGEKQHPFSNTWTWLLMDVKQQLGLPFSVYPSDSFLASLIPTPRKCV